VCACAQATTGARGAGLGGPVGSIRARRSESELDAYRFVDAGDLDRYLPPFITARVAAALRGRARGATVYLPWTGS